MVTLALLLAPAPALGARVLEAQRGGTGTLTGQFAGPDGLGFDVPPAGDVVTAGNGTPRLQRFTSAGAFPDEWKVAEPAGLGLPSIERLVGARLDMEWIVGPRPSDRHTGGRWAPAEPVRPAITRSGCPPRSTAGSR